VKTRFFWISNLYVFDKLRVDRIESEETRKLQITQYRFIVPWKWGQYKVWK